MRSLTLASLVLALVTSQPAAQSQGLQALLDAELTAFPANTDEVFRHRFLLERTQRHINADIVL